MKKPNKMSRNKTKNALRVATRNVTNAYNRVPELVNGAKTELKSAKKVVQANFKKAQVQLRSAQRKTENYITKNPKKAAAIAAGVGAAIGAAIALYWSSQQSKEGD